MNTSHKCRDEVDFVVMCGSISTRLGTYKKEFDKAEGKVRAKWPQAFIWNPSAMGHGKSRAFYMQKCLNHICEVADKNSVLYVMNNFEESDGAKVELALAKYCGMNIVYED